MVQPAPGARDGRGWACDASAQLHRNGSTPIPPPGCPSWLLPPSSASNRVCSFIHVWWGTEDDHPVHSSSTPCGSCSEGGSQAAARAVRALAGMTSPAIRPCWHLKMSPAARKGLSRSYQLKLGDDLEYMKDILESMAAVFKDAEKQSVKNESVRLWLKRLKDVASDISFMMDDYQDITEVPKLSCCTGRYKKMVLGNKMKNMREKLKKLNKQRKNFNFNQDITTNQSQQHNDERETTSYVKQEEILGRDAEKKEIVGILSASHNKEGTMIVPIYGLGGMGKSTLAKLVYNDTQLPYEHRVWVFVSQEFDLKKIGNSIISQLLPHEKHQNLELLQMVYKHLEELLATGKKILIILDDLWQDDVSKLKDLKDMIHVDKEGSMVHVLVTTRSESIANQICTNKTYKLEPLEDDACWDIIKTNSGFEEKRNKKKLEKIGLDIAKKCRGVALAAQVLGHMLRSKELDGWLEINNSDIWNQPFGADDPQHNNKVLPYLKLSYEQMPQKLRICFSYCSIFPKGHDIFEDDLVHQWIALDFIKKPLEGKEYINQLLGMSFLQHSKLSTISEMNATTYNMHDLVHDLARLVIEDELIVIDAAGKVKTTEQKYCQYGFLINYDGQRKLSDILAKKLWALHFSSSSKLGPHVGSFSFAKRLRILDFNECSGIILPSSIGQLKQLKCLIAPELHDKSLTEAIAHLSKLQYLNLRGSSQVSALPESIGKLRSLIYLGLSGCSGIIEVPESLGELNSLMHLDLSNCSGITNLPISIGNLISLQHLDLSRCSSVKEIPESFGGLKQLQHLNLSHCRSITRLPESIGSLSSLQYLDMKSNRSMKEFPVSFQNLRNLVHLDLSDYCSAEGLPGALRGLTSLEHLNIADFRIDESLGEQLCDAMRNLTSLRYLNMEEVQCSLDFIGTLTSLEVLDYSVHSNVMSLPDSIGNLKMLHTLCLSGLFDLRSLPDCIGNLTKLRRLSLSFCSSMEFLPDSIGNLKMLRTLDLSYCRHLISLPDSISEITDLKSLLLDGCSAELIEQANSMLDYSLTLPLFMVRGDDVSGSSNLPRLVSANVGMLRIRCLENVRSLEEARKVKLLDKYKLTDLNLTWTENVNRFVDDENLLGELVPPRGLRNLCLMGYSGLRFPSWSMTISHYLPDLVRISLFSLPKCNNLPPLGQLPNLQELLIYDCDSFTKIDRDFCGGIGAFSRLSKLTLEHMDGLEEWCTTYSFGDGVEEFMFPVLDDLVIFSCPKLRLTPCPPACRYWAIKCSDEVISSLEKFGKYKGRATSSTQTTTLCISICGSKTVRVFQHFPALQRLSLGICYNLMSLPESIRNLKSLQDLGLYSCGSISALPEWLGDLSSLESITIEGYPGIKSLPPCIQQLKKLRSLQIEENQELKRWCESEENKRNLSHIKITYVDCDQLK